MSVLPIFGQNLRILCDRRGDQAAASLALGLSRVQFQRYLRGEAFPKPHLLQQICHYFGVDARVVIEPLTPLLQRDMQQWRLGGGQGVDNGFIEAARYACGDHNYFTPSGEFPDGHYIVWRKSMALAHKVTRLVVAVKTLTQGRVVQGYDLAPWAKGATVLPEVTAAQRRYRGMVLRQAVGYSVVFYHAAPSLSISHAYLRPAPYGPDVTLTGYVSLGRSAAPGMNRISPTVWDKVAPGCAALRVACRSSGLLEERDVPELVLNVITAPVQ